MESVFLIIDVGLLIPNPEKNYLKKVLWRKFLGVKYLEKSFFHPFTISNTTENAESKKYSKSSPGLFFLFVLSWQI